MNKIRTYGCVSIQYTYFTVFARFAKARQHQGRASRVSTGSAHRTELHSLKSHDPHPPMAPPAHFRIQGWDPLLIILQIVAYQSFHYLAVSLLLPILLLFFADPTALAVEGGAANVAMVMDWREFLSAGSFGLVYDSARAYVVASSWFTASFIE